MNPTNSDATFLFSCLSDEVGIESPSFFFAPKVTTTIPASTLPSNISPLDVVKINDQAHAPSDVSQGSLILRIHDDGIGFYFIVNETVNKDQIVTNLQKCQTSKIKRPY